MAAVRKPVLLTVFGALFWVCGVHTLDCHDQSAVEQAQKDCVAKLQVPTDIKDVANLVQYDPNAVCSKDTNYADGIGCALRVLKQCQTETGHDPDVISSDTKLADMLFYMCERISGLNVPCLTSTQPLIKQCVENKASQLSGLSEAERTNPDSVVCARYRWNAECEWTLLAKCGCLTDRMFVKISKALSSHHACSPIQIDQPECNPQTDTFISGAPPDSTPIDG